MATTSIPKIKTVLDLVNALKANPTGVSFLKILRNIDIPIQEFERFYTWNDDHYTRNRLLRTDDFELVITCWEKGQSSPIHDYNSQESWIHPIQGCLKEERFLITSDGLEKVSSLLLGPTEFSYMVDSVDIHRYSNDYNGRSVSLHLYSRPVEQWTEYSQESGKGTLKNVQYDKVYSFNKEGVIQEF